MTVPGMSDRTVTGGGGRGSPRSRRVRPPARSADWGPSEKVPYSCYREAPPQGSRAGAAWTGVSRHLAPRFGGSGGVVTGSLAGSRL